jgi:hypothetical protein
VLAQQETAKVKGGYILEIWAMPDRKDKWAGELGTFLSGIHWLSDKLRALMQLIMTIALILGAIYLVIRFIRWAWENPIF